MEDKGHIAFDLVLQKSLSSFYSFPGGCDFDKNSLSAHPSVLVESEDSFSPLDGSRLVEGKASIHFS